MMTSNKVRHDLQNSGSIETNDAYTRRLVTEAKQWAGYAQRNSNLSSTRVNNMALEATAFSLRYRAHSIAIPTKLVGTRALQDALELLVTTNASPWHKLDLSMSEARIEAYYEGVLLGWLWPGHVWVWPLLTVGLEVRLLTVTGTDEEWKWLGCNVVITEVTRAIEAATSRHTTQVAQESHQLIRVL
jgi:hypothetical protein